jgi:hypothetical protein
MVYPIFTWLFPRLTWQRLQANPLILVVIGV